MRTLGAVLLGILCAAPLALLVDWARSSRLARVEASLASVPGDAIGPAGPFPPGKAACAPLLQDGSLEAWLAGRFYSRTSSSARRLRARWAFALEEPGGTCGKRAPNRLCATRPGGPR